MCIRDSYITKPFNILEVKARIKAIMRRTAASQPRKEESKMIEAGDLKLDCESRRLFILGREVNLTAKEFDLLELLVNNPNKVYGRENLCLLYTSLLELLMCFHQNGSARSLIDTAGLHADNTVLHDVDDADAVLAAETVQLTDNIGNLHLLAVDGGRNTFLEGHGHILALLRSFFRGDAEYQQVIVVRLTGRILELKTLVADMPDVAVTAVAGVCGERKMNAVCLAVCDLILAGLHEMCIRDRYKGAPRSALPPLPEFPAYFSRPFSLHSP